MKKTMRFFPFLMVVIMLFTACNTHKLEGTYVSEDEKISYVFQTNGTVRVFEYSIFYDGTYEYDKERDLYVVETHFGAFNFLNEIQLDGEDLILTSADPTDSNTIRLIRQ